MSTPPPHPSQTPGAGAIENRAGSTTSDPRQTLQLVTFGIGDEEFAIEILAVQEIVRMMPITDVPQSPPSVVGVVNLRGQITPVVDLRHRFGIEPRQHDQDARIIVVEVESRVLGFIVDKVHEVMQIDASVVDPTPSVATTVDSSYIRGVGKLEDRLLILLNLERLFTHQDSDPALTEEQAEGDAHAEPAARSEAA